MFVYSVGKNEFMKLPLRKQRELLFKEYARQNFNDTHSFYKTRNGATPVEKYLSLKVFVGKIIDKLMGWNIV